MTILEVADGAALAYDDEGRLIVLKPTDTFPWWSDHLGNLCHPDDFEWNLP